MGINTKPFQMLPKMRRGKNISQLILWSQYYLQIETKDITRKLPISFMNMNREIPNTGKPNLAAYKEDYKPWPSTIYPKNAKLIQHMTVTVTAPYEHRSKALRKY